jgi:hypothetical protein
MGRVKRRIRTGGRMKIQVCHSGDDVFIGWKPSGFIEDCRGFALLRRRNGVEESVSTWVGFENQTHEEGERRYSTSWPIQRYQWTDYMANPGDRLQYRVVPVVGPDKDHLLPKTSLASDWTKEIRLEHQVDKGIEVYFNRGIVAAQWVSRRLGTTDHDLKSGTLEKVIETPGDSFGDYLMGPLGKKLLEVLEEASVSCRDREHALTAALSAS